MMYSQTSIQNEEIPNEMIKDSSCFGSALERSGKCKISKRRTWGTENVRMNTVKVSQIRFYGGSTQLS